MVAIVFRRGCLCIPFEWLAHVISMTILSVGERDLITYSDHKNLRSLTKSSFCPLDVNNNEHEERKHKWTQLPATLSFDFWRKNNQPPETATPTRILLII